jgi:hypothetical protein
MGDPVFVKPERGVSVELLSETLEEEEQRTKHSQSWRKRLSMRRPKETRSRPSSVFDHFSKRRKRWHRERLGKDSGRAPEARFRSWYAWPARLPPVSRPAKRRGASLPTSLHQHVAAAAIPFRLCAVTAEELVGGQYNPEDDAPSLVPASEAKHRGPLPDTEIGQGETLYPTAEKMLQPDLATV